MVSGATVWNSDSRITRLYKLVMDWVMLLSYTHRSKFASIAWGSLLCNWVLYYTKSHYLVHVVDLFSLLLIQCDTGNVTLVLIYTIILDKYS